MSRIQRFLPTGALVITGAVLSAVALAGCGAGQIAQTSSQQAAVTGASAGTGPIVLRDVQIEFPEQAKGGTLYPRGGTAPLSMSIVNSSIEADRLVSASSPAAASVQISGESEVPPGRVLLIEGAPAAAAPPAAARPSGEPPAEASASAAPTGAAPTNAAPTSAAPTSAAAPAEEAGKPEGQIVLTGLTEDIRAGLTYPLVLNFERAGQITVSVPVGFPKEPREDEPAE